MKLSDSPFAVGTPEHSEWVKFTYIPTVDRERAAEDRRRYGAESIGVNLIHGGLEDSTKAYAEKKLDALLETIEQQAKFLVEAFEQLQVTLDFAVDAMRRAFGDLGVTVFLKHLPPARPADDMVDAAVWSYQQLNRAERRRRGRVGPYREPRECPRHGGPAYRCGYCQRS